MRLNKEGKTELRKVIEEKLAKVPYGQRVHLDKELLEQLLFEEIVYNKSTGAKLKLPIWSGSVLKKIDLSEISFEDVSWSLLCRDSYDCGYDEILDDETWKKFNGNNKAYFGYVDYEWTNAKIDFTKSWEYKVTGTIILTDCNFQGTDLSNNDMSKVKRILWCTLNGTKLNMPTQDKVMPGFYAEESDFVDIDLSSYTLDATKMVIGFGTSHFNSDCCLMNTGVKIINYTKEAMEQASVKEGYDLLPVFNDHLRENHFAGCYINGKLFTSSYEREDLAREKKEEYEKMKADLIAATTKSIEQQVGGFGRK